MTSLEDTVIGAVLDRLADHIDGVWINDHLPPHEQLEQNLPAIVVEDMPGSTAGVPLGGSPLVHDIAVDVMIFALDLSMARALGAAVERIVFAMVLDVGSPVSQVSQPVTMHKRPDWNARVKRVGGEFTLRASTAR